jgi:AraC family transcriptional regulator, regulatory protein of adaptative response / methylated-DNA-[protein]-cysteine methyltransferase
MTYRRIEQAIRYLNAHSRSQPRLEEVARHVGLSSFHFQRLFRRWAGVSPKRWLQHLTAGHARQLLWNSASVLETTFRTGLSSPGRLHDLLVAVEAMSPGEVSRRGEGLELRFGVHPSPFGTCLVVRTPRGICNLEFLDPEDEDEDSAVVAVESLAVRWPGASLEEDKAGTARLVAAIFRDQGRPGRQPFTLHLRGTNFQLQVWRALLRIPPGSAISYGGLAKGLGRPTATRAVASAIARNPVAYLIPCHRVLRSTGAIGDYRWGPARKQAILARESASSLEESCAD